MGDASVLFIDTLTGFEYTSISASSNEISLLIGHTYRLKTTDPEISAKINSSNTFTLSEETESITVDVTSNPDVTISGFITSEDNVLSPSSITSLTFVNMEDESLTGTATVSDDLTYTATVKPGSYNTVAVTDNGYYTINRVDVGEEGVSGEEVYFAKETSKTYYLPDDINSENPSLDYSGFKWNNETSVTGDNGATITVPVSGKQKVTVAGWYSGTWNINGQNEVTATSGSNANNPVTNTYTTNGTETTVTVNVTSTDVSAYLYWIEVEDVVEPKYEISVPGDYPTLTKAIDAIGKMDRAEGEAGRVTITLTDDLQEQVLVDAPYVSIIGNGHTVSWYYGTTAKYYSVDKNGYYSESLFRDKYELTNASGSLWGGVVIVTGDYFYAEDVTFKNTYNYEVTDKEILDGATQDVEINDVMQSVVRTKESPVVSYAYKERANAFYTNADHIECYRVNILSSQDTLGVNGDRAGAYAYFKECKIGGNVDYICGGGNMVFDDCELELYGYTDNDNPSYITATRDSKYLFRNCVVTGNDNGGPLATAYYGRPWTYGADVKFINTQTNGRIPEAGWHDWSNGATVEEVAYGEYGNLNGTNEFKSTYSSKIMTDEQYNEIINSIDDVYLGGWKPVHYVPCIAVKDEVATGSAIETVKINSGNDLLIYGAVNAEDVDKANSIGFVLSTLDKLFNKEPYTDNNVYSKIQYTDENGLEKEIVADEGTYLFAYVVEGINTNTDASNLFAKIVQNSGTSKVYGTATEIPLETVNAPAGQ